MNRITFLRTSTITACVLLVSALVWLSFEYGIDASESPHTGVGDLTASIEKVVTSEARNLTRHSPFPNSDDQPQESLVTASLAPRQTRVTASSLHTGKHIQSLIYIRKD